MTERTEILFQFLGCYFHQDWGLDDLGWQDVVNRFVRQEGKESARGVAREVNKLLTEVHSDVRLARVLDESGCYYRAGSVSETRGWLENVSAALSAAAQQ